MVRDSAGHHKVMHRLGNGLEVEAAQVAGNPVAGNLLCGDVAGAVPLREQLPELFHDRRVIQRGHNESRLPASTVLRYSTRRTPACQRKRLSDTEREKADG